MSKPYKDFEPNWYEGDYSDKSYRSIFRWGDKNFHKHPNENLYKAIKSYFHMSDEDFKQYDGDIGLDEVHFDVPKKIIKDEDIKYFKKLLGDEFVRDDDYSRLSVSYGKTMFDLLRLRKKIIENIPDVVLYPNSKEEIENIVAYCNEHLIPVYVYGGGSSVTRGVEAMKGGVSLDMRLRFNKVNMRPQLVT